MKKVTFEENSTIDYKELNDSHIIGIEYAKGDRYFIEKINDKYFVVGLCASINESLNVQNGYELLQDLVKRHDRDDIEVRVFTTIQKLYSWMAEQ